jgi:hypothetical protein
MCLNASNPVAALTVLSRCFGSVGSFYVLGAGASVPHVPTTDQLSERILHSFLEGGIFQTEPIERDIVFSRIIRDPEYWKDPMRWELVQRLPPAYAISKLPELLSARPSVPVANYEVFNLAAKPSTIFNMNVDGLASRICKEHRVLEMHGRSPSPELLERSGWKTYTEAILEFPELPPLLVPGMVLPGPEPADVLVRVEYRTAQRLINAAGYVSIIGYSLGGMDDIHTYAFLASRIPRSHQAVLVVSREPYEVMYRLSDALKSSHVHGISAYWEYLARAILFPGECRKYHPTPGGSFCAYCVGYRYEALLDATA